MSKSPPRYLDQTVAKWTVANDDHVLKGPEAALLTVLDSKEFSILNYDIAMRRGRQAQAQTIRLLVGQLGRANSPARRSVGSRCRSRTERVMGEPISQVSRNSRPSPPK